MYKATKLVETTGLKLNLTSKMDTLFFRGIQRLFSVKYLFEEANAV